jgi:type IV secretory pathway TraG/TraD family ATPase VirD4
VGRVSRPRSFLFTAEEVSTLVHPPVQGATMADAASVDARELPAPVGLPTPRTHTGLAVLGTTSFRGRSQPFGIAPDDRLRHMVIFGKTGTGKSTLLRNLLATDIAAGRGVTFIDPHGDTVDDLVGLIPTARTNDVIFVDPGDPHGVPSLNLLACAQPRLKPLVASAVLTAFKKLYADSWGPRLEHLLRNALLLLLDVPGATLANVLDLLSDDRYRRHALLHATDPIVRGFWEREFAGMPQKLRAEASSPVQNKIGHFVTNPTLRRIIAEPRSTLDLRRVLDQGKVLLVSLSKGRIGEDASTLLGSLVVTALQIAAQSRADTPEAKRRDHFAYVDEFHSFATDSFASILSEARKYRLSLTLATQYVEQIDIAVRAAIFGNAGSLVSFQVGPQDAELLALQLGPEVTPNDLLRLPRYRALARLLLAGVPSRPFTMRTLAPLPPSRACQQPDVVRRRSRHQYAGERLATARS